MDDADDLLAPHLLEPVGDHGSRDLGRVALAQRPAPEGPADLEAGPTLGIEKPDPADHVIALAFGDGPHTVAAQVPVSDQHGDAAPGLVAGLRAPVSQVAGDFRIGHHRGVFLEIAVAQLAQDQTLGFQAGNDELAHSVDPRMSRQVYFAHRSIVRECQTSLPRSRSCRREETFDPDPSWEDGLAARWSSTAGSMKPSSSSSPERPSTSDPPFYWKGHSTISTP